MLLLIFRYLFFEFFPGWLLFSEIIMLLLIFRYLFFKFFPGWLLFSKIIMLLLIFRYLFLKSFPGWLLFKGASRLLPAAARNLVSVPQTTVVNPRQIANRRPWKKRTEKVRQLSLTSSAGEEGGSLSTAPKIHPEEESRLWSPLFLSLTLLLLKK